MTAGLSGGDAEKGARARCPQDRHLSPGGHRSARLPEATCPPEAAGPQRCAHPPPLAASGAVPALSGPRLAPTCQRRLWESLGRGRWPGRANLSGQGALGFHHSGCCLLGTSYLPGIRLKYHHYVIMLFYLLFASCGLGVPLNPFDG